MTYKSLPPIKKYISLYNKTQHTYHGTHQSWARIQLRWLTRLVGLMVYDVDQLSASFELLRTYCGSSVHFIFLGITSSLGIFSTAINLDDPQTVLIPDGMFYEFKPKDAPIGQGRNLLTLDQLEIGRSYELVITTLSGFYRYQTQKTFLVVGRYHDTPTVLIDKD